MNLSLWIHPKSIPRIILRGETVLFKFIICIGEFVFAEREYGRIKEKKSVFPLIYKRKQTARFDIELNFP